MMLAADGEQAVGRMGVLAVILAVVDIAEFAVAIVTAALLIVQGVPSIFVAGDGAREVDVTSSACSSRSRSVVS